MVEPNLGLMAYATCRRAASSLFSQLKDVLVLEQVTTPQDGELAQECLGIQ